MIYHQDNSAQTTNRDFILAINLQNESTIATIRLRHRRTKGSGSRSTSLAMMFKLAQSASKKWRRLRGHQLITHVINNHNIKDGIIQENAV